MTRKEVLDAAAAAVLKDRNVTHGTPENSFSCIAEHWTTFLKFRRPGPILAHEVCTMMGLFKSARQTMNPLHADNWTDEIGYAACGVELATEVDNLTPLATDNITIKR